MFFRKLLVIRMIAHTQTSTIYLFNQVGVLCLISWMSAQTARGRRAFLTERARKGTLERERERVNKRGGSASANTLCLRKEGIRKKITKSMSNLFPKRKIRDVPGKQRDKFKLRLNLLSDQQSFSCKDRHSTARKRKQNCSEVPVFLVWFFFWVPVCSSTTVS